MECKIGVEAATATVERDSMPCVLTLMRRSLLPGMALLPFKIVLANETKGEIRS
jgi:hypothetical protein